MLTINERDLLMWKVANGHEEIADAADRALNIMAQMGLELDPALMAVSYFNDILNMDMDEPGLRALHYANLFYGHETQVFSLLIDVLRRCDDEERLMEVREALGSESMHREILAKLRKERGR